MSKIPGTEGWVPLKSIVTSLPSELVCVDFWPAKNNTNESVYVFVVTDHFIKLAHALQCQNQTAKQIAHKLCDKLFCLYGFPEKLHSNRGSN